MKKIFILFTFLAMCFTNKAQSLVNVASGTNLFVKSGTIFRAGSISITPSSDFTLTDIKLDTGSTVSYPTANSYIKNVATFSSNTPAFSGTIRYYYNDAQLNGLPESILLLNVYNGSSWQHFGTASNDVTLNYVQAMTVSNLTLLQTTLASSLNPLPLQWGVINAARQNQQIKIQWQVLQEEDIAFYSVERSTDGSNWITIANNITAFNSANKQPYSAIDNSPSASRTYYRIKQIDRDGHFNYSPIAIAAALQEGYKLLIYPNPVIDKLYIGNSSAASIKQIMLYNAAGSQVKSWNAVQQSYNVQDLSAGVYYIVIQLSDGSRQQFKLSKP